MSDELKRMVEQARGYKMSREEIRQQAISFAYGNGHIEDSGITREAITRAVDAMYDDRDAHSAE